jgi:ADP-heptose:LPS heptosyltransferase
MRRPPRRDPVDQAMRPTVRARQAAITLLCSALKLLFWPARRRRPAPGAPARILVYRRCCLGDVLMTTPLLAALDAAYPAATITYAVGEWSRPALAGNPRVDQILPLPAAPNWRQWVATIGGLRRGGYDLAILPERSPLVHLAAWLAGIPRRVGLDSGGRGFALTDPVAVRGVRHEVDRALDLAPALEIALPERRLEFFPAAEATARVEALLTECGARPPLFVVHPGGGANPGVVMDGKRWPAERFGALADGLLARHGGTAILVGAAADRAAVAGAAAAMREPVIDLCGALSFPELAALCRLATLYAGNDSGTSHLAEACGAPTVVIFGPTDPAMYGPVDGVGAAVWDEQACAPSVRRGDLTRAGDGGRCIDAVRVEDVLAAAGRVLARAPAAQITGAARCRRSGG